MKKNICILGFLILFSFFVSGGFSLGIFIGSGIGLLGFMSFNLN